VPVAWGCRDRAADLHFPLSHSVVPSRTATPDSPSGANTKRTLRDQPGVELASEVLRLAGAGTPGLGVSLLARRPRGAGVRLLYDDNRHSRARLGGEFSASEEGRNVYIGVGTVLAIILIIVLLVWISREGVLRDKH
jgi:hypothetical protein